tara:strand:- start:444 stop:878 length:435 start_codon:yes stop_codon:yes gene_type:complete
MTPFFAHLENADMDTLLENGKVFYYDPKTRIRLAGMSIILIGKIKNNHCIRGPGSVLGLDNLVLKEDDFQFWEVIEQSTILLIELPDRFLKEWSAPIAVSLVEERVSKSDSEVGSNIDMAELRFKHLKKMVLEKSKDMGLDVKQ